MTMHTTDRRRAPRSLATLLVLALAGLAAAVAGPPAPAPAAVPVGLTWKMSNHAFTSSSLAPAHATTAPATKTADGFVFPTVTSAQYNADTGAARVAYSGAYELGNTAQGNYRIKVADPVVVVNADDTGRVDATVSYALFTSGSHVWSTPVPDTTVATFTIPDASVVEDGTNVSFTVTPDFVVRTDNPPNVLGWRRFPQPLMDLLPTSLDGHFQETGSVSADPNKPPAPLTVSFDASPATIIVTDLEQTYDGTPRPVTVATDPEGLDTVVTYDGESTVPTDAGTYDVSVTLDEELTSAAPFSGTLTIAQATQVIDLEELTDRVEDDPSFTVTPTATSGLPVALAAAGACSVDGYEVTPEGSGTCTLTATQAGDDNWEAATPVERTFRVLSHDEVFVRRAYGVVLDRDADDAGVAHWLSRMEAGASRAAMADALARSGEGRARVVDLAYAAVLDRRPDAAGRAYWADRLAGGLPPEDVVARLVASPEATSHSGGTIEGLVELLYQVHLDRPGDEAGIAYWAGRLGAADDDVARRSASLAFGRTGEATAVGTSTAIDRACGDAGSATSAERDAVTARWLGSGHHPLRTAALALATICPTVEPI